MLRFVPVVLVALALCGCGKAPDSQNVADTSNSAGAALENSANELDATTDNLTDATVDNIDAADNGANTSDNASR